MEDTRILQMYSDRNEDAIIQTRNTYGAYCAAVARRILDDDGDVEEVLNDTWLRAWNSIPPGKPENLKLYLARIARNLSFDRFRSQSREKRGGGEVTLALQELSECEAPAASPEQLLEAEELRSGVNGFLATLPKRDRGIFLLRYFYLEPTQTIANRYAVREDHVRTILSRTRKKLKQYLMKEGLLNG